MGRPKNPVPAYKKHPRKNEARCWVGGRWVSLGAYDSAESLAEYARVCAEARAGGAAAIAGKRPSVNEVLLAFWEFAQSYYRRPDGSQTSSVVEFRHALRPVRELYGHTPAAEFGPLVLKAVRQAMVDAGWCRTNVNRRVWRVHRVFKWAAAEELVPALVPLALACVPALAAGRSGVRESEPVGPVAAAAVEATLPFLTPTLGAMVGLQRLAGLRPGEVRLLQPADLDAAGDPWVFRPAYHKMSWADRAKAIPLGPRARALLAPLLAGLAPDRYVFSPAVSKLERAAMKRAARMSKVQPSQADRRKPAGELLRRPGPFFTDHAYASAIAWAAKRAGVGPWHPNQLRHTFASEVRRRFGLEASQVLLGHARADVTQVYAEKNLELAARVAAEIG